ncbi:hypothetical protein RJ639_042753 [Escallonia herrerae]|uniref:Reverse transcriptase RNase H-like domain-containing protein n=1 Tax=Escallonia herrerae TaxID=1293975 RepID=A0AA89B157_9ASTE|nr:hypothetical protein RJ639_042753 [Escallonia herrerae]
MAPVKGKPMILYTAAIDTSLGALLAQHNDQGKENSLYYLSWTLVGAKLTYMAMEKFNIEYVPQKAVKGQDLADFLAAHPVLDDSPLVLDLPDEEVMQTEIKKGWEMYFDGASRSLDDYLLSKFQKLQIRHVRRGVNGRADALASLAASLGLSKKEKMIITVGARRVLHPYGKVSVDVQTDAVLITSERLEG